MKMKEIEAQILGKNFNFNIPDSIKAEDFLKIISFVKNKMHKIRREGDDLDLFKLGLLTAVNIAEEYFSLKKENERLCFMLNKIDQIVSPFEEEVQPSIRFSS
jgi:cell division protein ZapA (FtsZ GTPase activity inhibitor)